MADETPRDCSLRELWLCEWCWVTPSLQFTTVALATPSICFSTL